LDRLREFGHEVARDASWGGSCGGLERIRVMSVCWSGSCCWMSVPIVILALEVRIVGVGLWSTWW